ncbi:uncharacterized protein LOC120352627 isoform X2 [Nilaparvata lugens]|uniref:uncharacterized protein LOC120352627 isoform X2 n=1 Tax=Nilaparvata lugens TaxID=108931 RepID=UPI00193CA5F5|nr:uncharacterized protein LOC120352627 isoform X2 [Nilaparvata lugens]
MGSAGIKMYDCAPLQGHKRPSPLCPGHCTAFSRLPIPMLDRDKFLQFYYCFRSASLSHPPRPGKIYKPGGTFREALPPFQCNIPCCKEMSDDYTQSLAVSLVYLLPWCHHRALSSSPGSPATNSGDITASITSSGWLS